MRRQTTFRATPVFAVLVLALTAGAETNWPQWRGPSCDGRSEATGLPVTWSETENILWKTPLPSWSGSTPIVWGEHIFLTSPSKPEGETDPGNRRDAGGPELLLLCLSTGDGALRWERKLDDGNEIRNKQNLSSPSPVTDGKTVWVMTGTGVVTALDFDGNILWTRDIQEDYGPFGMQFGYGSSPLLHGGMLVIQVLHGYFTDDPSYVLALDAASGGERWRVERPTDAVLESPDSYSTPTVLHYPDRTEIVVAGGDYVTGHDPETGEEVWRGGGLNPKNSDRYRTIASAVAVDGMIYVPTRQRPLLAFRAGGSGDITRSHLAWKWDRPRGPDVPTPVCDGKHFYMVDDRGMITCLDAKAGNVVWGSEQTARGTVSASPLLADGKIYITNEDAVTSVVAAGPEFRLLATNAVDSSYTLSSLGVSDGRLYLRTATHLYCVGE